MTRRIRGQSIESDSVSGRTIKADSVDTDHLCTNAVTRSKIRPGAVDGSLIEAQSIRIKHLHPEMLPYPPGRQITLGALPSSTDMTLTTTWTDVPGTSSTVTTAYANAIYLVQATFDFRVTTAGTGTSGEGRIVVDGTTDTAVAIMNDAAVRATVGIGRGDDGGMLTPGSYVIKLQARKSVADGGTMSCLAQGTQRLTWIQDAPGIPSP